MPITLKAARYNAGLRQSEAAELIGIKPQTLSSWERGKTIPNVKYIPKIEKAYSISYDELVFLPVNNALSVINNKN